MIEHQRLLVVEKKEKKDGISLSVLRKGLVHFFLIYTGDKTFVFLLRGFLWAVGQLIVCRLLIRHVFICAGFYIFSDKSLSLPAAILSRVACLCIADSLWKAIKLWCEELSARKMRERVENRSVRLLCHVRYCWCRWVMEGNGTLCLMTSDGSHDISCTLLTDWSSHVKQSSFPWLQFAATKRDFFFFSL